LVTMVNGCGAVGGTRTGRGKPVPMPLYRHKYWDRPRAAEVSNQRLSGELIPSLALRICIETPRSTRLRPEMASADVGFGTVP
jgi:hypothetical protein